MFAEDGSNAALIMEVTNPSPHPSYPIYLSAQILANSRVYMSRIYRKLNSYHSPDHAIYYTDTDSLILHARCLPIMEECQLIGSDLGQLSCDLTDPFKGKFAKILAAVWAAPKGPYALAYVSADNPTLMEKVKAKGIPHPEGPFPYGEEIDIEANINEDEKAEWWEKLSLMDRVRAWMKDPDHLEPPVEAIGQKFYYWQHQEEAYFAKHINRKMIQLMMTNEGMTKKRSTPGGIEPPSG